jgi:hypothetical protein
MGKRVLEVHGLDASPYLRPYAHCSKGRVMLYHMLIFLFFIFNLQFPFFLIQIIYSHCHHLVAGGYNFAAD